VSGVILSSPRLPMVDWRFVLVVGTAIHLTFFFFTFRLGAWVSGKVSSLAFWFVPSPYDSSLQLQILVLIT